MRRQTIELTRLNEAFAILSGPPTTEVSSFGEGQRSRQGKGLRRSLAQACC